MKGDRKFEDTEIVTASRATARRERMRVIRRERAKEMRERVKVAKRERAKVSRAERIERVKLVRAELRVRAVIACFGKVASADGPPTSSEIAFVRNYLVQHQDGREPTGLTREGLSAEGSAAAVRIRAYLTSCSPRIAERRRLVEALFELAVCDGELASREEEAISRVASLLRFTFQQYTRIRRRLTTMNRMQAARGDAATDRRVTRPRTSSPLQRCYELLECSPDDSDAAIKRAYRRLAAQVHPDKHAADAPGGEEARRHVRRFQQLQAAYAEVRAYRGRLQGKDLTRDDKA